MSTATAPVEVVVPGNVSDMAVGPDEAGRPAVWILDDFANVLYEADADSGRVQRVIGIGPGSPTGTTEDFIAVADDYVWVGSQLNNALTRVVVKDSGVEGVLEVAFPLTAVTTGDAVWVADVTGTVHGFDAKSLQPRGTVQPGYAVRGLAFLAGRVWVSSAGASGSTVTLLRSFDPSTRSLSEALRVGAGPSSYLSVAAGSLFLSDADSGRITRVDPATAAVSGVYSEPVGSYVVPGDAPVPWVFNYKSGDLTPLDLGGGHVGAGIKLGPHAALLRYAGGALWVADPPTDRVTRMALP